MSYKTHKSHCRIDKFRLNIDSYKEMIEKDLAEKIIRDIPHKDLVKLFNIEWHLNNADDMAEGRASIRYKDQATIEGMIDNKNCGS